MGPCGIDVHIYMSVHGTLTAGSGSCACSVPGARKYVTSAPKEAEQRGNIIIRQFEIDIDTHVFLFGNSTVENFIIIIKFGFHQFYFIFGFEIFGISKLTTISGALSLE